MEANITFSCVIPKGYPQEGAVTLLVLFIYASDSNRLVKWSGWPVNLPNQGGNDVFIASPHLKKQLILLRTLPG